MGPPDLPLDTTTSADDEQLTIYRRLGGAERVAIAFRLGALARGLALSGIRRRHPGYDDRTARRALNRLLLGDEIMRQVYPQDDLVEP